MRKAVIMEVRKAEIKDLDIVVRMKIDMFKEVGSVTLLQENAESKIYAKYKELYSQEKCCHYLVYENSKAVACGGAVIKEDVPFCFSKLRCTDMSLMYIAFPKREETDMLLL